MITKEVKKLPAANYLALISKRVTSAIKKKIGAQAIVGAGTTNTIKGIYNADTKVMPTDDKTSDIELKGIDADTLNANYDNSKAVNYFKINAPSLFDDALFDGVN